MKEFTVFKPGTFTVMPNTHLMDKTLSLKAVGLLSKMLNLPDDWDYSLKGLVAINKESYDTIRSILSELKEHDYIEIIKSRAENGTFRYNYLIFTNPSQKAEIMRNYPDSKNPYMDNPDMVKPDMENYDQYNIKEYNMNNIKDKYDNIDKTKIPEHHYLTKELFKLNYISDTDSSSFLFDDLFNNYLSNGFTFGNIISSIHYIVPRVVNRKFIDEDGKEIKNKYGYFKNAFESNISKFNNMPDELYPEKNDDYEL